MPVQRPEACVILKKRKTACMDRDLGHAISQGSGKLHACMENWGMQFLKEAKNCMPVQKYEACVFMKIEKQHVYQMMKSKHFSYTK